jgi:ABC-2 type transport system permease protein
MTDMTDNIDAIDIIEPGGECTASGQGLASSGEQERSMRTFSAMVVAAVKMQLRNRLFLVTSLGIALLSILVFGWLLGGSGGLKLSLAVVNQDTSPVGGQLLRQLQQSDALQVQAESQSAALAELSAGHRDAVIVIGPDFGAALQQGHAQIKVYYNQSNPTTLAMTRQAIQSVVDSLNDGLTGRQPPLSIQEEGVSVHSLRTIDFILPGMLGLMLMWTNLNAGATFVDWRERGILRRLAATPLLPGTLISAQMIARVLLSLLQAVVLLVVGTYLFHVQVVGSWLLLALVVLLGALAMLAIGLGIGGLAKNSDAVQGIVFLVSFPMMFLGGSYFAVSDAPGFLQPLINVLPLTYLNDALRQIVNSGAGFSAVQGDLLTLGAWVIAGSLVARRLFNWER